MRDTIDSSPDMIQIRHKAGRNQFDINVEAALSNRQSVGAGSVNANVGTSGVGGGAVVGGGGGFIGGDGGGGGDGIGRCFGAHTMISMPDRTVKSIALIEVMHDYVLVPQPDGSVRSARVIAKSVSVARAWLEIATSEKPTIVKPTHLFRDVSGRWSMIQYLDVVIARRDEKWDSVPLIHKEPVQGPERLFYTLGVEDSAHAFIADGYWVKNNKPLDEPVF